MRFIGNTHIQNILTKKLQRASFHHAYIFAGPEHVGKFFLAQNFAYAVQKGNAGFPDVLHEKNESVFVLAPQKEEKKGVIKIRQIDVESIRKMQKAVALSSGTNKKKVFILDAAHKLTVQAQNALLKTLEEPHENVILMLITHAMDTLLPTTKSRCETVSFRLPSQEEFRDILSTFDTHMYDLALGRPGLYFQLQQDTEKKDQQEKFLRMLTSFDRFSLHEKLILSEKMAKDIPKTQEMFHLWIYFLQKRALETTSDQKSIFRKIDALLANLEILNTSRANKRLLIETTLLNF